MAPNAVASAKELIQAAPDSSLQQQLNAERDAFVANLFHDNGGEGLAAFFGKWRPDFK
jgi:enoyl-CoA hydratase/carnithine racemase